MFVSAHRKFFKPYNPHLNLDFVNERSHGVLLFTNRHICTSFFTMCITALNSLLKSCFNMQSKVFVKYSRKKNVFSPYMRVWDVETSASNNFVLVKLSPFLYLWLLISLVPWNFVLLILSLSGVGGLWFFLGEYF